MATVTTTSAAKGKPTATKMIGRAEFPEKEVGCDSEWLIDFLLN
jgi:hypothetical protein